MSASSTQPPFIAISGSLPPTGSVTRSPLPPLGRSGGYPNVHRYCGRLRLPIGRPTSLWLSLGSAVPTYVSRRRRRRRGLLRSWNLWTHAAFSDSVGTLAPSHEDDLGCGELLLPAAFAICRCLNPHHRSLSLRLAAPRCCRRPLHNDGYPRQSLFRSSITRLSSSLSTLRSFPSRSRGRTATQDSLPAGGQPLPGGGHNPARSQMSFSLVYMASSSSKFRNAINGRVRLPPTCHPSLQSRLRATQSALSRAAGA